MDFCSRADVGEDDKAIVLKQDIRWRLLCYNPTTQEIVKGTDANLQKMQEEDILLTGATRSVLLMRNINRVSGINIQKRSADSKWIIEIKVDLEQTKDAYSSILLTGLRLVEILGYLGGDSASCAASA